MLSPLPLAAQECPDGTWTTYTRAGDGPDNDHINDIAFAPDGTAFLATNDLYDVLEAGGGLSVRAPDGTWRVVRRGENGLSSDTVYSVLVTPDGALWTGAFAGVDRASLVVDPAQPQGWSPVPEPPGAPPLRDVHDLHRDGDGALWLATVFGVVRLHADQWSRYAGEPGEEGLIARALTEGPDGRLWVGTAGQGLQVHDGERWTRLDRRSDGPGNDHTYDLAFDREGRLWVGTAIGVHVLDGERWTVYTSRNSPLRDDDVRAVLVDRDGRIWLGTHDGLSIWADGVWHSCGPAKTGDAGPAHPLVISLAEAPDGSIWIGTYGGGVTVFTPAAGP